MDIFDYIVLNNPDAAADLCDQYDYPYDSNDEMANGLFMIANSDNSDNAEGWVDVMGIHPDRTPLIQLFSTKSCTNCKLNGAMRMSANVIPRDSIIYASADGSTTPVATTTPTITTTNNTPASNTITISTTNTLIIAGTLLLLGVILYKERN